MRDPAEIFDLDDADLDESVPGLGGSGLDPLDIFREMIEGMDIDQILKISGFSAAERRRFKDLERQLGREAVIDSIVQMMRQQTQGAAPSSGDPGPGPRGPSGPGHTPRNPPRPTPKGPDDSDPDEPPPEQLDLFP
jgi:hypothetical protein